MRSLLRWSLGDLQRRRSFHGVVQPWAGPASWASSIRLSVCYGDGIHTFIDDQRSSRVSVDQRVAIVGSGGRIGLWNERNPAARHDYLRVYSLVEGYALLRP